MAIRVLPAVATFVLLVAVAFDRGGYFPGPWGWTTSISAWAALAAVITERRVRLGRPAAAVGVLLGAFALWTALSATWSLSPTESALDAQRVAVYAAVFLAVALWARRSSRHLLIGVWLATSVVCGWALLTRLVPDRFGVDYVGSGARLSAPVGYWNSLAIYAAMGELLALALACDARKRLVRAFAASSLPLLLTTLYFTYSRGGWVSLGASLAVLFAASPRRVRLAAPVVVGVLTGGSTVWWASTIHSLTVAAPSIASAAHDGHRFLLVVLAASATAGVVEWRIAALDDRLVLSHAWQRRARIVAAALALIAVVLVTVLFGSPTTIARKSWHAFTGPNAAPSSTLNGRLFSFSGTGRVAQWRVAWRQARTHPLAGTGARTFEIEWNRLRPNGSHVRDAHNLYLQTLAELGVIGAALLLVALALPLATGVAARRRPLLAGAVAAYFAFLLHSVVDWDWQITGVTLPAIVFAAVLTRAPARPLQPTGRRVLIAGAVLLAVAGLYAIAQRLPLDRLDQALARKQWARAEHDARQASGLAPWSSEPWLKLGEAELAAGLTPQANAAFTRAVAHDRNNWVIWWDLARSSRGFERAYALLHVRLLNPRAPAATQP